MDAENARRFATYRGMALVLGESMKRIRNSVSKLERMELIERKASNKGSEYRITDKGRRYLNFNTDGFNDFAQISVVLKHATMWRILTIVQSLSNEYE